MKKILLSLLVITPVIGANENIRNIDISNLRYEVIKSLKDNKTMLLENERGYGEYIDRKIKANIIHSEIENNKEKGSLVEIGTEDISFIFQGLKKERNTYNKDVFSLGVNNINYEDFENIYSVKGININYSESDYYLTSFYEVGKFIETNYNSYFDIYLGLGAGYFDNKDVKDYYSLNGYLGVGYVIEKGNFKFYVNSEYEYIYLDEEKDTEENLFTINGGFDYALSENISINAKYSKNFLGDIDGYRASLGFTYLF